MSVTRTAEHPRVTKPYTEETWAEIDRLGHQIDVALETSDVRLSMGGEPTFVSIDDPDGAEWNTDRARARQAPSRGAAVRAHAGALLAGQPAALRPGKVVPGRAAAALGADQLLPQGRHADLAAPRADREGAGAGQARHAAPPRRAASADPHHRAAGRRRRGSDPARVRGRLLLRLERAAAAGEHVAVRPAARRRAGARAAGARVRAGADLGGRLRAADRARRATPTRATTGAPASGRCAASAFS